MTPSQQVKEFCKIHGLKVDSKNNVITISKRVVHDSWFIECFDNYKEAYSYLLAAKNSFVINAKQLPWTTYNVK